MNVINEKKTRKWNAVSLSSELQGYICKFKTLICRSYQLAQGDLYTIENLINRSMVKVLAR